MGRMRRALAVVLLVVTSAACSSDSGSYSDSDRSELSALCVDSGLRAAPGRQLDESCEELAKTFTDLADRSDCVDRMDLLRATMTSFLATAQAGDAVGAEATMSDRITKCAVGP